MAELLLTLVAGGCLLMFLIFMGGIYAAVGAIMADWVHKLVGDHKICVLVWIFGPGLTVLTVYWLGQFSLGVLLAGGF